MTTSDEKATCRGCGRELIGKPYWCGGSALHPITRKPCRHNHYGGYVCSETCDRRASLEHEQSMPGCYGKKTLSPYAEDSARKNWSTP